MNPSPTSDCCQSLPPLHQYSRARQDIRTILEAELQLSHRVRESLDIIRETFEQFGVEHVALSFNGGKDCTVMLHLVAAVLAEQQHKHPESWAPIKTLYVTHHSPFGEVDDFVEFVATSYSLDIIRTPPPMKQGLQEFLSSAPQIKAIFIGTRTTDPFSADILPIQPTDDDWPRVMRAHPILNWEYGDIWDFLKIANVPYCSLYDQGYTSLGGTTDTIPNPCLANPLRSSGYDEAFRLKDYSKERDGRVKRKT